MKQPRQNTEWYKLDNAAKIYPATNNSRWNAVYRCSVVLKERVDREVLQLALDGIIDRFPSLKVTLKKGVFWYYFQGTNVRPVVKREDNYPCQKFDIKCKEPLFRVLYSRNKISVEFFHSLTDGYGSVHFINTLLLKYFHLLGRKIDAPMFLHYSDTPTEEELEDSYQRYYNPEVGLQNRKETPAYHIVGNAELEGVLSVISGVIPTGQLSAKAKSYGATINQYIVGVLAYICYQMRKTDAKARRKKPVKIQFAINLRGMLKSVSLRNFSAVINIPLEETSEDMSFEEILRNMTENSKKMVTEENMRKFINANCDVERKWYVRIVPLFLKRLGLKLAFYSVGENLFTFSLSNIGRVNAPEDFKKYVERYEFILGAQKYNHNSLTVGSYNDQTVFNFSRNIKSARFEREFFRFLASQGLDVTVLGNRGKL